VAATRYVTPLREGGSLPAIVEADDDGLYVLKFRGAGQGIKALVAEVIAGELARALGLPVPDRARELSGHQAGALDPATSLGGKDLAVIGPTFTSFNVPLGTVYASNLTPDPETGLGAWNETLFIRTMRTGRHLGAGRPVLPPMPWRSIGDASDADLKALFAYLKSQPPIRNAVPPPKVSTEALDKLGRSYDALVQRDAPER